MTRSSFAPAFTLVELMISIALMLLLMAGINLIFSMAGKAVGAGQALSEAVRNSQAAGAVFNQDFDNVALDDAPFMILYSHTQPAFRNKADQLSDHDYVGGDTLANQYKQILTVDLDGKDSDGNGDPEGDTNVRGEIISPATYNDRNHRTDIFSFFTRGVYSRQTGSAGRFIDDQGSHEACIWYGHLAKGILIPANQGSLNPNSNLSSGKVVDPDCMPPGYLPASSPSSHLGVSNPDNQYATQWVLGRVAMLLQPQDPTASYRYMPETTWNGSGRPPDLSPLSYETKSINATNDPSRYIFQSRYDMASTTMDTFRTRLNAWITQVPADTWWFHFMTRDDVRYEMNPFLIRPVDNAQFARMTPAFLPACTQFIVEYAGDYLFQDAANNGIIRGSYKNINTTFDKTDGEIDYILTGTGANQQKRIRWYGLPRDIDGDGHIRVSNGFSGLSPDVLPLRDLIQGINGGQGAPFEKLTFTGANPNPTIPIKADYADVNNGMTSDDYYTCAWSSKDRKPSMIRITIVLDDPNARLSQGQTFEYVFKLK